MKLLFALGGFVVAVLLAMIFLAQNIDSSRTAQAVTGVEGGQKAGYPVKRDDAPPANLVATRAVGQKASPPDIESGGEGSNPSDSRSSNHFADISNMVGHQVVESLSGNVNPDLWMDIIAEFVQFPINPEPVADWRDESVTAYPFLIGESNVQAYLIQDKEDPLQTSLRVESVSDRLEAGAYRRYASLSIHFGPVLPDGTPESYALQSYGPVALGRNRRAGIETYKGRFAEGAIYQRLADGQAHCFRTGIEDGRPVKLEGNCKVDLNLDSMRVKLLFDRVQMLLEETK